MKKHVNISVTGEVQGVFFRDSARKKADELEITGFARNQPDGSVYIEAEGESDAIEEFIAYCVEGPGSASVRDLSVTKGALKRYAGFNVQ